MDDAEPCFRSAAAVALKAREVLISTQLPSYEERAVQMEQILKSAVLTSYYGEHGLGHRLGSCQVVLRVSDNICLKGPSSRHFKRIKRFSLGCL